MVERPWRLLLPLPVAGVTQMAIDRWLLEQGQPCLRFYQWQPSALSLGYHQTTIAEDWHYLNLELVRRPSGGRAVLHHGDLTYAVIVPPLPGSRRAIYSYLCGFLIAGWRSLGIELTYGQQEQGYIHNPSCFNTATAADLITKEGYKFIGSAQLKTQQGYLQHGSMMLRPDRELFSQIFTQPCPYAPGDCPLPVEEIIQALILAAKNHFNVEMVYDPLKPSEWQGIKKIEPLYHIRC